MELGEGTWGPVTAETRNVESSLQMSLVSEMQQIFVELSVHRLVEVISVVATKSAAGHTWKKNEAEAALFVS